MMHFPDSLPSFLPRTAKVQFHLSEMPNLLTDHCEYVSKQNKIKSIIVQLRTADPATLPLFGWRH